MPDEAQTAAIARICNDVWREKTRFYVPARVKHYASTGQISVIVDNSAMICCGAASKVLYKLPHGIKMHVNVSANINRNDGKYGRAQ